MCGFVELERLIFGMGLELLGRDGSWAEGGNGSDYIPNTYSEDTMMLWIMSWLC